MFATGASRPKAELDCSSPRTFSPISGEPSRGAICAASFRAPSPLSSQTWCLLPRARQCCVGPSFRRGRAGSATARPIGPAGWTAPAGPRRPLVWPRTKKAREAHEKLEKGGGGSHKGQGGGGGVPTLPQPSWPCVRRGPWSVAPGAEARGGRARRRPSAHADRGLGGDDRRLQESQDRRGARHSR